MATLSREDAAGVLQTPLAEIDHLVGAGRLHRIPLVTGIVRICQPSLFQDFALAAGEGVQG